MTVYFHGNFGLNRRYMADILKRALENSNITDEQLAQPQGYKAPFAAKYRTWLHKTGIAELRLPLQLTDMGQIVYRNDPHLQSPITQWHMHHELSRDPDRAETWHFFINEFLPRHPVFSRQELVEALREKLRRHSEKHFGVNSTMNPVIARKLIECYSDTEALGNLGLLGPESQGRYKSKQVKGLGPWNTPSLLNSAYEASAQ